MNPNWIKQGSRIAAASMLLLASALQAQETIIYSHGFEDNDGGFAALETINSAGWQWGTPSATTVGPGGAHSGVRCWGTVLDGPIPRTSDSSIVSPAIPLPVISANEILRVRFWAYVDLDGMRDRGEFFVSTNLTSWQSLIQFYNNMEHSGASAPTWKMYEFSLDPSFSGMPLYLRFRGVVFNPSPTFYCGGSGNLSGFYVDDIAVSKHIRSGTSKLFSMEAWEDPSSTASCPWVAPWNGSAFMAENDIYSVARGMAGEYTDAYLLRTSLAPLNGAYCFEVQERENETSFTDFAKLLALDHTPDVAVAPNGEGTLSAYRPADLLAPRSALNTASEDVLALVSTDDDQGFAAYSGDTVALDFQNVDISQSALLVLKVKGFISGGGEEKPFVGPPAVVIETRASDSSWIERGRLLPRFENSLGAFDLQPYLTPGQPVEVRLRSISHSTKYHRIDFAALYAGAKPAFTTTVMDPISASFGSQDILPLLANADGDRFKLTSGQKFSLSFPVAPQAEGTVRDFVFQSRGYYLPNSGSYLVYTWDGTAWVQRDSFTYPGTDATKSYDLSLFLPDPKGELRVRVWQDYQYEPAGIDQVAMSVEGTDAPLNYAWDYRNDESIFGIVQNSDNTKTSWSGCPRDRVTEFAFTSSTTNIPPHVYPVTPVGGTNPTQFDIHWIYGDFEGAPQTFVEIQLWTGPGATGNNLWNPAPFPGTNEFAIYTGPELGAGVYYIRVRANDGTDWGPWSEGTWPPGTSECGTQIGSASAPALNPQTGLMEQRVVVENTCTQPTSGPLRVLISSLPDGVVVYNATGTTTNDVPFVEYDGTIPASGSVTLTVEYYAANRTTFTPSLELEYCAATVPPGMEGTELSITRCQMLDGGCFLLEFTSVAGKSYQVQYVNNSSNWVPAMPTIKAVANRTQWVDSGPPKTEAPPSSGARLYRVVELP